MPNKINGREYLFDLLVKGGEFNKKYYSWSN